MPDGRRALLESSRQQLVAAMENASPRDLPPLSRELRLVLAELTKLDVKDEGSPADALAARRSARLTSRRPADSEST
jgi:hypothetical protein